jgi:MFS transporter, ACS family, solute carrier family 17 (sodium-dependent inorganic phosphate cotransporter), member 5
VRVLVSVAGFFGYFIQYIQRVNISVAIVCMVNDTAVKQQTFLQDSRINDDLSYNLTTILKTPEKCYFDGADDGGHQTNGKFVWDKKTQGLVLSAYFYGYISTQIIGGFLSFKLGASIVIGVSMLIGSVMTILNPIAANTSWIGIFVCRIILGMTHGVFWPGMSSLWANWAPPSERSRLVGLANSGSQIGNIVALPLSGILCVYGFAEGWGSIFYIFGGLGVVWFVFWMLVTSKSPKEHRFIGEAEREYILSQTNNTGAKLPPTPWLKIATSRSFIALVFAHFCSNFGTYLYLMQLPTYMKEVLKFNIKSNGTLSAAPYVLFWALIVGSSVIGDKLIETKTLTKQNVRRLFNTLGKLITNYKNNYSKCYSIEFK